MATFTADQQSEMARHGLSLSAGDEEVELWKGDFTAEQSRAMARAGTAMPDGSYPIPDAEHLGKAIKAVGRGTNNAHSTIRRHIIARAKTLGLSAQIPDTWGADGSLKKAEAAELIVPLWKDDAQQIVYGVVLSPGVKDSQGDVASAAEIEKAAHRYLVQSRKHDVQHGQPADIQTVESYIAPQDLVLAGEKVLKGAWVLAAHISDRATYERVGKADAPDALTGWSIEGSAIRDLEAD